MSLPPATVRALFEPYFLLVPGTQERYNELLALRAQFIASRIGTEHSLGLRDQIKNLLRSQQACLRKTWDPRKSPWCPTHWLTRGALTTAGLVELFKARVVSDGVLDPGHPEAESLLAQLLVNHAPICCWLEGVHAR